MDSISISRLARVHPELSRRITQLASMCEDYPFRVTQGLRTWNEQAALYAQGRESTDSVNARRKAVNWEPITDVQNVVVTHAAAGYSMHNFGLAVDIVPSDPNFPTFRPDYNTQHPSWLAILRRALSCGLNEGAQWTGVKRDYPHLFPSELFANPTDEMRQTFTDAGLIQVWKELKKLLPFNLPTGAQAT